MLSLIIGIDTCWYNPLHNPNTRDISVTYEIDDLEKIGDILDIQSKLHKNCSLIMEDDFQGSQLNEEFWLPVYLPQWSSRKMTKPSYDHNP